MNIVGAKPEPQETGIVPLLNSTTGPINNPAQ